MYICVCEAVSLCVSEQWTVKFQSNKWEEQLEKGWTIYTSTSLMFLP